MRIAFDAHKEQVDKSVLPYIFHPFHLAEQMTDKITTCVAFLHDIVENTDITFNDLINAGFPDEVIDSLRLLTHDPYVPYMDYVGEIKKNPVATAVKLADLKHNSDAARLDVIDKWAMKRNEKYAKAIEFLEN